MKKVYRISLLLITFIFLTSYNPNKADLTSKKRDKFFSVQKIEIINNFLIDKKEIIEKLDSIYLRNIFLIKKDDIESPLKKMNFIEKIEVKKKYPDTIIIKIIETKPVGHLFKNKIKYLLDSSSNLILFEKKKTFDELPNIFGEEAEKNFLNFLKKLKMNNFPSEQIVNYYYFKIDRWDIQLQNGKTIKFPYNNVEYAIQKSIELLKRKDFEKYNIIDLRVNGKIIVE